MGASSVCLHLDLHLLGCSPSSSGLKYQVLPEDLHLITPKHPQTVHKSTPVAPQDRPRSTWHVVHHRRSQDHPFVPSERAEPRWRPEGGVAWQQKPRKGKGNCFSEMATFRNWLKRESIQMVQSFSDVELFLEGPKVVFKEAP